MYVQWLKLILLPVIACIALAFPVHAAAASAQLQPLSATELHAIRVEAAARESARDSQHPAKSLPPWKELTPEKLQRAIASGQLQTANYFSNQGILIDQAMAWNLVHFQNLSDIKRFFELVYGKGFFTEPPATARSDFGRKKVDYYTDGSAGPEGGALSAIYNCMPDATWDVESLDSALWLMQRGGGLNQSNAQDFGKCVRKQRDDAEGASPDDPDTARGAQSALIIEDRLSRQLLAHGCDATGPDQCLALLHALTSLDERHPALVQIVKKLDHQVGASSPVSLPMPAKPEQIDFHNAVQMDDFHRKQNDLWRQGIVLSAELVQMRLHPQAWTQSQHQRGIDAAIVLMLNQRKFDWTFSPYGQHGSYNYSFADPWEQLSVDAKKSPQVADRLTQLGDAAAKPKGCALAKLQASNQPAEFWLGYGLRKLRDENQACDALPVDWIADRYVTASKTQQTGLLAPIAELKALLAKATINSEPIEDFMASRCPETGFGADYWGICARNAAKIAATRAQQAAEKLAEEKAALIIKNDPCQNGTSDDLLKQFGYIDDKGDSIGPATVSVCQPLPGADGIGVIEVFRNLSPLGADTQDRDGDYDLHLMLADRNGALLAQGHFKDAATSDAVSLDGIGVDPKRYALNANTSAFGVTTLNVAHCYHCSYSEGTLSLFVRDGKVLHGVLLSMPWSSTQDADQPDATTGCEGASDTTTRSIATAATTHHGYADLLITTTIDHDPGSMKDSAESCPKAPEVKSPPAPKPDVWIYDGKQYQPVKPPAA